MLWIEMAFDSVHGGGDWSFSKCLWSPTLNRVGHAHGWWKNFERIKAGDRVLHIREVVGEANFVGTSTCFTAGEVTTDRPPDPGEWGYSQSFYRVRLMDFDSFGEGLPLPELFRVKDAEFREYFAKNEKRRGNSKRSLFYVIQGDRLQCQNGAYLSEVDKELSEIILSESLMRISRLEHVTVAERLRIVVTRVGQDEFSRAVRENHGSVCCFPGCDVADDQFLVGSHIARWSDVPELRGNVSNGLCLCLMHDKAFEQGLFTIGETLSVKVLPRCTDSDWGRTYILPFDEQSLQSGKTPPSDEALLHHWVRVGY